MRSNNERLIDRYIAGRMSPAEEKQFLARAEADPALRRLLKTEQVIGRAIQKDLAAIPLAATEPSPLILAKLAASNPAAIAGAAANATASSGSSFIGTFLFGTKLAQVIVAIVAVTGIAVGTYALAPLFDTSSREKIVEPFVRPATPAAVAAPAGAEKAPAAFPETGKEMRLQAPAKPAAADRNGPAATTSGTTSGTTRAADASSRRDAITPENPARSATAAAPARKNAPASEPAPIEVENPKVKVNINIDQKKSQ